MKQSHDHWLWFIALLCMGLAGTEGSAAIGRTSGLPGVSPSGAATYTVPLWVPPGINGLQPSLALVYSSNRGEGPFGVGWGLAGLSVIERCVSTWAQNGVARDVRNDNQDRFCLDGNQLRRTGGTYGAAGSTYQTELETYARIKAYGSAGNGPAYFFVEAADGLVYEYGNTADSRIESVGQTTARAWALNKIRDRAGNEVLFTYTEDTTNGSYRIAAIEYTRNAGAGVGTPHYKVEFFYETLPVGEVDAGYLAGSLIKRITRVDRIDVTHDASLVRRYELNYEANLSNTGKSRLASIQECSGSLDCFPATDFTYQNGTPGLTSESNAGFSVPTGTFPWSLDVNGNGLKDLVYSSSATSGAGVWMVAFANNSGGYQAPVNTGIPNTNFNGAIPIDFNNDGREDLLVPYSGGTWWVMLGTDTGLGTPVNTGAPVTATGSGANARAIDIDGDGYEDLVWADLVGYQGGDAIRYRLRIPGGNFSSTDNALVQMPVDAKINQDVFHPRQSFPDRVPDFNGDGRGDIAYVRVDRVWTGVSWNYITTIQVICPGGTSFAVPSSNGSAPFFGDFNGYGRTDLMYFKSGGSGSVMVRYSTGKSFTGEQFVVSYPTFGLPHLVLDWDGDGRHDLLAREPVTNNLFVYRSTGEGLLAGVNTGINASGMGAATVTDINGDGLGDLVYWTGSGAWKIRRHNGVAPDLLASATDAFGVSATFTYGRLTDPTVHTRSTGAVFPEVDVQPAIWVVKQLAATDGSGTGANWNSTMSYQGARSHRQGRGFLGFREQTTIDSRLGYNLKTEAIFEQSFPRTGLPKTVTTRQSSGTKVQETNWIWAVLSWGTAQSTQRLFPYPTSIVTKDHELSGTHYRTAATTVAAINSASGLITDRTTTVTEIATGLNTNSFRNERVLHSVVFNDTTNWCLGRPQTTQVTASHSLPDGAGITRTMGQTWSGLDCRPTQQQLQPGDPALQVTVALDYDSFGNLSSQTVTGSGMAGRNTTLSWGTRGQFPEAVTNPLSQISTQAWNYALGVPSSATDPNGLVTNWLYDGFGRPTRETRPDNSGQHTDRVGAGDLLLGLRPALALPPDAPGQEQLGRHLPHHDD
jgi:YD repeat-containing protein